MGFFSKLFGLHDNDEEASFVIKWADNRAKLLNKSNEINPLNLFTIIMIGVSNFSRTAKEIYPASSGLEKHFSLEPYSEDSSLFEIGCYTYFRVDLWLFKNRPELRNHISQTFVREFVNLFAQALNMPDIGDVFNSRLEIYGNLARRGAEVKEFINYLS